MLFSTNVEHNMLGSLQRSKEYLFIKQNLRTQGSRVNIFQASLGSGGGQGEELVHKKRVWTVVAPK